MTTTEHANNEPASTVSALQTMIADSVNRLFADQVTADLRRAFDRGDNGPVLALQELVAELGLEHALVPTEADGSGASWAETYPVFRAIGFAQAPLPLAESMLARLLLARAGIAQPEGDLTIIEASRQASLTQTGSTLSGTATAVPWARSAQWAVISTTDRQLLLVDLQQDGVSISAADNLAAEPRDSVVFEVAHITAAQPRPFASLSEPVWFLGAMIRSAMLVGALECVLTEAVNHANTRVQFGKPLGKFQAIQQALATVAGAIASARVATRVAFDAAPVDDQTRSTLAFDIAVAKIRCGEAATLATNVTHQVLGAIGFTQEHTLHFATRRLWSWRDEFGSDASWAQALGEAAIAAGGDGFWQKLTARAL